MEEDGVITASTISSKSSSLLYGGVSVSVSSSPSSSPPSLLSPSSSTLMSSSSVRKTTTTTTTTSSSSTAAVAALIDPVIQTELWLRTRLEDSWSASNIAALLHVDVLDAIAKCFVDLDTPIKLRVLLAFLHMKKRILSEEGARDAMKVIMDAAKNDSDDWVRELHAIVKDFPSTNQLSFDGVGSTVFGSLYEDVKKALQSVSEGGIYPLQLPYLQHSVASKQTSLLPKRHTHFGSARLPSTAKEIKLLLRSRATADASVGGGASGRITGKSDPNRIVKSSSSRSGFGIPSRRVNISSSGSVGRFGSSGSSTMQRRNSGIQLLDKDESLKLADQATTKKRKLVEAEKAERQSSKRNKRTPAKVEDGTNNDESFNNTAEIGIDGGASPTPVITNELEPMLPGYTSSGEQVGYTSNTDIVYSATLPSSGSELPAYAPTLMPISSSSTAANVHVAAISSSLLSNELNAGGIAPSYIASTLTSELSDSSHTMASALSNTTSGVTPSGANSDLHSLFSQALGGASVSTSSGIGLGLSNDNSLAGLLNAPPSAYPTIGTSSSANIVTTSTLSKKSFESDVNDKELQRVRHAEKALSTANRISDSDRLLVLDFIYDRDRTPRNATKLKPVIVVHEEISETEEVRKLQQNCVELNYSSNEWRIFKRSKKL